MEENFLKHEENIAKILGRIVSLCKQTDLADLAEKRRTSSKELRQKHFENN